MALGELRMRSVLIKESLEKAMKGSDDGQAGGRKEFDKLMYYVTQLEELIN